MTKSDKRTTLRYGERLALILFGLSVAGIAGFDTAIRAVVSLFGLFVVLAAMGVVEVTMALWYRSQRSSVRG